MLFNNIICVWRQFLSILFKNCLKLFGSNLVLLKLNLISGNDLCLGTWQSAQCTTKQKSKQQFSAKTMSVCLDSGMYFDIKKVLWEIFKRFKNNDWNILMFLPNTFYLIYFMGTCSLNFSRTLAISPFYFVTLDDFPIYFPTRMKINFKSPLGTSFSSF